MLYCKGKHQFTSFSLVLISVVEFFNGATSQFIQLQFRSDNWIKREWCALHQSSQPTMNYPTINKLHLHVLWLQPESHIIPLCRYSYSDHTGTKIKNSYNAARKNTLYKTQELLLVCYQNYRKIFSHAERTKMSGLQTLRNWHHSFEFVKVPLLIVIWTPIVKVFCEGNLRPEMFITVEKAYN